MYNKFEDNDCTDISINIKKKLNFLSKNLGLEINKNPNYSECILNTLFKTLECSSSLLSCLT